MMEETIGKDKNGEVVTLFLVDDDDVDAMGVIRALRKRRIGNPVIRAKDGVDALEKLRNGEVPRPYIVLLDLNMPRMGGLEFVKAVREDYDLATSVIFVLTTSQSDQDIAEAYKNHVAGYVVKSDMEDIFSKLGNMLNIYWQISFLPQN